MKFLNTPTTQQQVDAIIARDAEQRAGQQPQLVRVEHREFGTSPHKKFDVRFHYADGTSLYFAPTKTGAF